MKKVFYICINKETNVNKQNLNIMTFTTEQSEKIMDFIIDGFTKEEAIAKVLIAEGEEITKELNHAYVPNVMATENAKAYVDARNKSDKNIAQIIAIFGESNFLSCKIASKKNKVKALVTGFNKIGLNKLTKSKGCYGLEA